MTAAKRGICLIINNDNFLPSSGLKNRVGTVLDRGKFIFIQFWKSQMKTAHSWVCIYTYVSSRVSAGCVYMAGL